MGRLSIAEIDRKVDELRGYNDEDVSDVWRYGGATAVHEAAHAICVYALGGVVGRICVGPTVRDKNLMGVVYHGKLRPFDDLVVCVAGELAEARHEDRPVDWHGSPCSHDMATVRKIVGFKDFERSAQFILAVERAKQILHDTSCALACLTVRLKRPPFQIHSDDFKELMEKLNVREISSNS